MAVKYTKIQQEKVTGKREVYGTRYEEKASVALDIVLKSERGGEVAMVE